MNKDGLRLCIPPEYQGGYDAERAAMGRDFAEKTAFLFLGFIYAQFRKLRAELTRVTLLLVASQRRERVLEVCLKESEASNFRLSEELATANKRIAKLEADAQTYIFALNAATGIIQFAAAARKQPGSGG